MNAMKSLNHVVEPMRYLCILTLIFPVLMISLPAEANYPGVTLTGFGTPTVDGVMSPGEWDNAGRIDYSANVRCDNGICTTPATLFIMNDETNLYIALKIKKLSFDLVSTAFEFDNNHDGVWPKEGDDVIVVNAGISHPAQLIDDFRTMQPPCPPYSVCGFRDTDFGGTNDGITAASDDGEFRYIEISKPLSSKDYLHDFNLKPGETIGFHHSLRLFMDVPCNPDLSCFADTEFPLWPFFGDILIATRQLGDLVMRYYLDVLDRSPEPGAAARWMIEIQRIVPLGIDVKEGFQGLAKFFFDSEEYGLKGKDDVAFVTDLYQTFLNRAPDPDGLSFWVDYLGQGLTRDMLITQFAYCDEFKLYIEGLFGAGATRPENNLVNDLYRGFLNRFPDTGGFNGWVGLMRTAQCTGAMAVRDATYQIALSFSQSAEYTLRARNNQQYVEDLYNGIFRRGADPAGFINWVAALNTMTREQVLRDFTDSPEFQFRVQEVINAGCLP